MTKEEFLELFQECLQDGSIKVMVNVEGDKTETVIQVLGFKLHLQKGYVFL